MAWTAADIPSQAGRTAAVTGATSGIGLHTAAGLTEAGAEVVLAVRDVGASRSTTCRASVATAAGASTRRRSSRTCCSCSSSGAARPRPAWNCTAWPPIPGRGHPKLVSASKAAHDEAATRRLWEVSQELTGVRYL